MKWWKELISTTMKKVIWSSPKPIIFKGDPAAAMVVFIVLLTMKMCRKKKDWNSGKNEWSQIEMIKLAVSLKSLRLTFFPQSPEIPTTQGIDLVIKIKSNLYEY